jgi:hypothetical protein
MSYINKAQGVWQCPECGKVKRQRHPSKYDVPCGECRMRMGWKNVIRASI